MKNVKKIFALALALMMVLSLATTAFATEISFTGGADGAVYSAYKLLNATQDGDKYAYTVNAKYAEILKAETGKTEDEAIVAYISNLDAAGIRAFANDVYAAIKTAGLAADEVSVNDIIADAEQGYYLIAETTLGDSHPEYPEYNGDTYSLVMVDTVGDDKITITTKESFPDVDKEVLEKNDSTGVSHWGEHADYDIGDKVEYRVRATVSGQYEGYINYWYEIGDTMDAGLTYNYDLKIMVGSTEVTDLFTIVEDDHGFTATANLKEWTEFTVTHNTVFNLTYSATLNENAVSGVPGNKNAVQVKFQNDPYAIDDPTDPGTTPPDVNIVFTFDSIVNKVDEKGAPLTTAGFTLYKYNHDTASWVQIGTERTGASTYDFRGLDEGIYKLVETKVPDGYNKADDIEFHIHPVYDTTKDPVQMTGLEIVDKDGDPLDIFKIDITGDKKFEENTYEFETTIVNKPGKELPTTGGMGTTLFYIFGGLMFVGAAVLLVTKKRMAY